VRASSKPDGDYSIALVQSEAESLRTPALDLAPHLLQRSPFQTELVTEGDASKLSEGPSEFECIVFGFNVLYLSPNLRRAVTRHPPDTNLLVLHQLTTEALGFLKGDLRVEARPVPQERHTACIPTGRESKEEVLLNWPQDVLQGEGPESLSAPVERHLVSPVPSSPWQPVLDIKQDGLRLHVVLRTAGVYEKRIILCNLWLEARSEQHMRLLDNMISYCAAGFPEVSVHQPITSIDQMEDVATRLRLQGIRPIRLQRLDFSSWPLRRCRQLIVGTDTNVTDLLPQADEWMRRGGAFVVVEDEDTTMRYRSTDRWFLVEQWAAWFNSVGSATWHGGTDPSGEQHEGSIHKSRAVLAVLRRLREDFDSSTLSRVGLPDMQEFRRPISSLLKKRWQSRFEHTISTACAAFELTQWLDEALEAPASDQSRSSRGRQQRRTGDRDAVLSETEERWIERWLRGAFDGAGPEDQLDIARCLRDRKLFAEAIERLPGTPLPPSLAMKARAAAVSCDVSVESLSRGELLAESEDSELETSLLLACRYLQTWVVFAGRFPQDPLAENDQGVQMALATIGRSGRLLHQESRSGAPLSIDAEAASAELLALFEYFGRTSAATHVLGWPGEAVATATLEVVLSETDRTRQALRAAESKNAANEAKLRALKVAQFILGLLAAGGAGLVYLLTWSIVWTTVTFVGLSAVLHLLHLSSPWVGWLATKIGGGVTGVAGGIAEVLFPADENRGSSS
jgi:hypothetical protein